MSIWACRRDLLTLNEGASGSFWSWLPVFTLVKCGAGCWIYVSLRVPGGRWRWYRWLGAHKHEH